MFICENINTTSNFDIKMQRFVKYSEVLVIVLRSGGLPHTRAQANTSFVMTVGVEMLSCAVVGDCFTLRAGLRFVRNDVGVEMLSFAVVGDCFTLVHLLALLAMTVERNFWILSVIKNHPTGT